MAAQLHEPPRLDGKGLPPSDEPTSVKAIAPRAVHAVAVTQELAALYVGGDVAQACLGSGLQK